MAFFVSLGNRRVYLDVHLVNLGLEVGLDTISLNLHSWRHAFVFNTEGLVGEVDVSRYFEGVEVISLGKSLDISYHSLFQVRVIHKAGQVGLFAVLFSPGEAAIIYDCNHDGVTLERAAVDETLADVLAERVHTFKLGWRYILSLGKLEDLLGPVNHCDRSIRVCYAHISRTEPAFRIECFIGLVLAIEVAFENVGTYHLDLTSGVRFVRRVVVHLGDVFQPQFVAPDWSAHVAQDWVMRMGSGDSSRGFRKSVSLQDGTGETYFERSEYLLIYRSRPRAHEFNFTSQYSFDFVEDESVVQSMCVSGVIVVVG